ncbi:MAG: hypothetical protein AAF203_09995 [Pseudomonadota bacterium]
MSFRFLVTALIASLSIVFSFQNCGSPSAISGGSELASDPLAGTFLSLPDAPMTQEEVDEISIDCPERDEGLEISNPERGCFVFMIGTPEENSPGILVNTEEPSIQEVIDKAKVNLSNVDNPPDVVIIVNPDANVPLNINTVGANFSTYVYYGGSSIRLGSSNPSSKVSSNSIEAYHFPPGIQHSSN